MTEDVARLNINPVIHAFFSVRGKLHEWFTAPHDEAREEGKRIPAAHGAVVAAALQTGSNEAGALSLFAPQQVTYRKKLPDGFY